MRYLIPVLLLALIVSVAGARPRQCPPPLQAPPMPEALEVAQAPELEKKADSCECGISCECVNCTGDCSCGVVAPPVIDTHSAPITRIVYSAPVVHQPISYSAPVCGVTYSNRIVYPPPAIQQQPIYTSSPIYRTTGYPRYSQPISRPAPVRTMSYRRSYGGDNCST